MKPTLIFDADHTLIEFDADEKRAFSLAFADFGVSLSEEERSACRDYSYECWAALGLNDVHTESIQKRYHELYRAYVPVMFESLSKKYGLGQHAAELSRRFMEYLSLPSHPIGQAKEVLFRLHQNYRVAIATNGLTQMQTSRLLEFLPAVDFLFISERMDCIKPSEAFFLQMVKKLGVSPKDCWMIGDSLSSDIAGAVNSGMTSCWFNRFGAKNEKPFSPTYEISAIEQVEELLKNGG